MTTKTFYTVNSHSLTLFMKLYRTHHHNHANPSENARKEIDPCRTFYV